MGCVTIGVFEACGLRRGAWHTPARQQQRQTDRQAPA